MEKEIQLDASERVKLLPDTTPGQDGFEEAEIALQELTKLYRASHDTSKIPEIIELSKKTLARTGEGTEQRPIWLHALAWSLYQSYKHIEPDEEFIKDAVTFERKAIESSLVSEHIETFSYWLSLELGDYLYHTADMSDLDEAIVLTRFVVHKMIDGSPRKTSTKVNLAVLLKERYGRLGKEQDFTDGAAYMEEALCEVSDAVHDRSQWYEIFAQLYDLKHLRSQATEDLEKSVEFRRQSVFAIDDDPEGNKSADIKSEQMIAKPAQQFKLALTIDELWDDRGAVQDLQEFTDLVTECIPATAEDDPEWLIRVRALFLALYRLYLETGQLEDLNKSIALNRAFLEKGGEEHSDWSAQLNNLSVLLAALYERTGSLADLDEAIRYGRQSL